MSFYSEFAAYYESVFPCRENVYSFLKSCLPRGGQKILDAGCGPGHYCGRFAAEGFEALGVDLDPAMIESAKRRFEQAEFYRLDIGHISELKRTRHFDLIYCIGNVASHLKPGAFEHFIKNVEHLLKPAGRWVFQVVNWDYILTHDAYHFPPKTAGSPGMLFLRDYEDISEEGLWFRTRLQSSEKTLFEGSVRLYPIPSARCLDMHRRAGFEHVHHFADFSGKPFDEAADTGSIYVFRNPPNVNVSS